MKDWDAAITESIQNPLTNLVTLDGDSFEGVYWRVGQRSTGATGKALEEAIKNSEQKLDEVKRSKHELDQWQRKLDTEEQNMDLAQ